jgi:hypothetical protein
MDVGKMTSANFMEVPQYDARMTAINADVAQRIRLGNLANWILSGAA